MNTIYPSRIARYIRRHGLRAAGSRAGARLYQIAVQNRVLVFSADLTRGIDVPSIPGGLHVERVAGEAGLDPTDRHALLTYWDPAVKRRQIRDRFGQGATLWLVKDGVRLVGFGWTIRGTTPPPVFVLLGPDDIRLFDFEVFPAWQGRGVNPALVQHVLWWSAQEGARRGILEVHEWNRPQIRSLAKTPFRQLGTARLVEFQGRSIVWSNRAATRDPRRVGFRRLREPD